MKPIPWLSRFGTNRNVSLIFLYKLSNGVARGVWSHASMATYIYLLENNSAKVPKLGYRSRSLICPATLITALVYRILRLA